MNRARNAAHSELSCSDCGRTLEPDFAIPCGCNAQLCETCFDRDHESHGPGLAGLHLPRAEQESVHFSSKSGEWNTPDAVLERVVRLLGAIDLDPCSNIDGARNVPAATHFTILDDGLSRDWSGRVFMNPPYGRQIRRWTSKLRDTYEIGHVSEAVALVPARTDTTWFFDLRSYARCFVRGRLKFGGAKNSAPFPSAVFYLGSDVARFDRVFSDLGDVFELHGRKQSGSWSSHERRIRSVERHQAEAQSKLGRLQEQERRAQ